MSIVVTAASGHLGRLVVQHLLDRGVTPSEVVAGARRPEAVKDLADLGVRTVALDYDDPATLSAAIGPGDVVLLVSGNEVGRRVPQHGNVVEAARTAGAARVVYTSAPKADDTTLVLAPEHRATEELLRASGVPFTILRNNWYAENYVPTLQQAAETGVVLSSTGTGRVAIAPRTDYAEAAAVVLTTDGHDGAVYELGNDVTYTHDDLAAALAEVLGRDVEHRSVSAEEHVEALLAAGLDEGTAGFVAALDGNIREGELEVVTGDLARLLGRPATPLVDALRPLVG